MIEIIIEEIKQQLGVELKLCDYFSGLKQFNGKNYFNVILEEKISESEVFNKLKRFSDKYKTIQIEPNGTKRVAVFIN